jgi:spore maturation protein CgeB
MKILFCQWNSICEPDMDEAFINLGFEVTRLKQTIENVDYDKKYLLKISDFLSMNQFDFVFSINYMPIISRVCNIYNTIYISWIVDSPLFQLYSNTIYNKCNRIFIFDRMLYNDFYKENPSGIYYLPLATSVSHLDQISINSENIEKFQTDISFVGSLYSEKCKFNGIKNLPDYLHGYINGIIEAQLKIYGYNLIEDALTDDIVNEFKKYAAWIPVAEDYRENDKAIVAHEYIGIKCSEIERTKLLTSLSDKYLVDLYTMSDTSSIKNIRNKGPARSRIDMPMIFKCSKINLNITAKTIRSGLSLRVFDILGSGGFLLTNYQSEIPEYFEIGKDLEVFSSEEDLLNKVEYYLNHDDERRQIALNGYQKVKSYHTYEHRILEMLQTIGIL